MPRDWPSSNEVVGAARLAAVSSGRSMPVPIVFVEMFTRSTLSFRPADCTGVIPLLPVLLVVIAIFLFRLCIRPWCHLHFLSSAISRHRTFCRRPSSSSFDFCVFMAFLASLGLDFIFFLKLNQNTTRRYSLTRLAGDQLSRDTQVSRFDVSPASLDHLSR